MRARPDQRPGEDAVRLPHHQAGRQEGRRRRGRSTKCGSSSPISSPFERAQAQAADLADSARKRRSRSRPISTRSAKAQGLTVQETGFFARDEPILGARPAPEVGGRAFDAEARRGRRAAPHRRAASCSRRSPAKQDPYVPKLDEVKDRVRDEVIKQKARELSQQKAAELAAKLKARARLREGGQGRRLRGEDDRAHRRATRRFPTSASRPRVDEAAFTLPDGAVSDPIATDNGTAVVKVLEKQEVTPDELDVDQGPLPRGAADRPPQPLLQRLHGEGEAEDEDRGQSRRAAARGRLDGPRRTRRLGDSKSLDVSSSLVPS